MQGCRLCMASYADVHGSADGANRQGQGHGLPQGRDLGAAIKETNTKRLRRHALAGGVRLGIVCVYVSFGVGSSYQSTLGLGLATCSGHAGAFYSALVV